MGLEILDGLSTGLWCFLKLSLSRRLFQLYYVWSLNIFTVYAVYVIVKLFVTILGSFNEGRQFIIINKGFVFSHRWANYCEFGEVSVNLESEIYEALNPLLSPPGTYLFQNI